MSVTEDKFEKFFNKFVKLLNLFKKGEKMDANSIIILGLCVVLFIVLILLYVKDSQTNKKFDRYDHIVNDNMNEIFILKKEVAKLKEELEMFDIGILADELDKQIDDKIEPVIKSLQNIDKLVNK